MATTVFTPSQQVLLKMFERDKSDKTAKEIQKVLADYYQKKLDEETDRLWNEGILNQARLDELRHKDLHAEMRAWRKAEKK